MNFEKDVYKLKQQVTNGAPWSFSNCWECVIQQYGMPLLHYCIRILYTIYTYCTPLNVVLLLIESVPAGITAISLIKNIYIWSRERMKQKQIEEQDIQLQIQILKTKVSMQEAEYSQRTEELRRRIEEFRKLRARVRQMVAADAELRHALRDTAPWDEDSDIHVTSAPEEREFLVQLLKELKYDQVGEEDAELAELSVAEHAASELTADDSEYSSASDADVKQNCSVKIVKVTNVFKVAYLKHYIKQKKLRRRAKHNVLKKKMDAVKKLLENWQHRLNMVINSNISMVNLGPTYELASQEAMGDFSKQDFRDFSETDSDIGNFNDNYYEQSISSCAEINHRNFMSRGFEEAEDTAISSGIRRSQVDTHYGGLRELECSPRPRCELFVLHEETSSQLSMAEAEHNAADENQYRDTVPT